MHVRTDGRADGHTHKQILCALLNSFYFISFLTVGLSYKQEFGAILKDHSTISTLSLLKHILCELILQKKAERGK